MQSKGYRKLALSGTTVGLITAAANGATTGVPQMASQVLISVESDKLVDEIAVRFTTDGTAPLAETTGTPLHGKEKLIFTGDIGPLKFVNEDTNATLHFEFFG